MKNQAFERQKIKCRLLQFLIGAFRVKDFTIHNSIRLLHISILDKEPEPAIAETLSVKLLGDKVCTSVCNKMKAK